MTDEHNELELERQHLAQILAVARAQLIAAEAEAAKGGAAIGGMSREMREEERRTFDSLLTADGFEAIVNLAQLNQLRAVNLSARELLLDKVRSLRAMLDAPFFARIDLAFGDGDCERVYIGRAMLKDERTHEIIIHDWRSPIASVFYRFGVGPVHYDAPGGRIDAEMTLKRQYEIKSGALEYFFDADVQVEDTFLRTMLSQNASPRMKAIVETIQRDQDLAIRDTAHDLLMVQGAAGSGKSSVALHRAAYLMYKGLASPLTAGDILILSPNPLFERYIYDVLPELGEKSAATVTLEQLLSEALGGAPVETRLDRYERIAREPVAMQHALRAAIAFKGSRAFAKILDRFVRELPARHLDFQDITYARRVLFTREQLRAAVLAEGEALPLGSRLQRLEAAVWNAVNRLKPARMEVLTDLARRSSRHALELDECARAYSILEYALLARRMHAFTRPDPRALYRQLLSDERAFRRLAKGEELPENLGEFLAATRSALDCESLLHEDASAIAYLALSIEGASTRIRQVLVDEAQDYTPLQYALLNKRYPRARFTVLGDINQSLDARTDMTLYDDISELLARRSALLIELNKSFRCTREILQFALQFLDAPTAIDGFNRSGDNPETHSASEADELISLIQTEITRSQNKGMKSIALITRTAREADIWQARLNLPRVNQSTRIPEGAFIIPLPLSKGLEFDSVLILNAHAWTDGDRRLLYVACTRALHRLTLFSFGNGEASA